MPIFQSVQAGPELERVFALPRRPIPDPASSEALALAGELTAMLRRVPVPYPFRCATDILYATQALALRELWETRGLLCPIRAGMGKTLTGYLAFAILRPKRPMLVVPASMLEDTIAEYQKFERDWRGPALADVTIFSYEKISHMGSGAKTLPDGSVIYDDIITRHRPDMIVMDECHRFGTVSATGTRRVGRYLAENQDVVVLGMSGTLIRKSLNDAAHIMHWCLGDSAPLPLEWEELAAWSDATDARSQNGKRTDYGSLLDYLTPEETRAFQETEFPDDARGIVCGMLGRRILETKGVVGSQDGPLSIPARLDPQEVLRPDEAIEEEYRRLLEGDGDRPAWALPDGTLLPDARSLARPLTTLSYGFYLQQEPPPPPEYRTAASSWFSEVRNVIKYRAHLRLDSEWMVRDAVDRGVLPEMTDLLAEWRAARAAYTAATGQNEPPSVPTWVSDEVVGEVKGWLKEGTGIVWVAYVALGERLTKELGIAYFGAGKVDAKGRHVLKLRKGEPAIMSIASVGTGTNTLQFKHSRNLWMSAPNEQSLARTHRPGQEADSVQNDIYLGSGQLLRRFWNAHATARNFAGAISKQSQRLEYMECSVPRALEEPGQRFGNAVDGDAGEDA